MELKIKPKKDSSLFGFEISLSRDSDLTSFYMPLMDFLPVVDYCALLTSETDNHSVEYLKKMRDYDCRDPFLFRGDPLGTNFMQDSIYLDIDHDEDTQTMRVTLLVLPYSERRYEAFLLGNYDFISALSKYSYALGTENSIEKIYDLRSHLRDTRIDLLTDVCHVLQEIQISDKKCKKILQNLLMDDIVYNEFKTWNRFDVANTLSMLSN